MKIIIRLIIITILLNISFFLGKSYNKVNKVTIQLLRIASDSHNKYKIVYLDNFANKNIVDTISLNIKNEELINILNSKNGNIIYLDSIAGKLSQKKQEEDQSRLDVIFNIILWIVMIFLGAIAFFFVVIFILFVTNNIHIGG